MMVKQIFIALILLTLFVRVSVADECIELFTKIHKAKSYLERATGIFPRESGMLVSLTSLPGEHGIGELGPSTFKLIDLLHSAGNKILQILPFNPTGYGNSPYQSISSFAGNPLLIGLDDLMKRGLLSIEEVLPLTKLPKDHIDFGGVIPLKQKLLLLAESRFAKVMTTVEKKRFAEFSAKNKDWLDDYALFITIKEQNGGGSWVNWPKELATRNPAALKKVAKDSAERINQIKIEQFLFDEQWNQFREYAHAKGIKIVGDLPMYVAHDSADLWSNKARFLVSDTGDLLYQSGVPGQVWGNPIYNWEFHQKEGFVWWKQRVMRLFERVDTIRFDYIQGFVSYWRIASSQKDLMKGENVKVPGRELFQMLQAEYEKVYGRTMSAIIEDLGVTEETNALFRDLNIPGMRTQQYFQYDYNRPENFPNNSVAYTGTHDHAPLAVFLKGLDGDSKRSLEGLSRPYGDVNSDDQLAQAMIRNLFSSKSNTAIVQLQDFLFTGEGSRMNTPGTSSGNWEWRFPSFDVDPKRIEWMRKLVKDTGR